MSPTTEVSKLPDTTPEVPVDPSLVTPGLLGFAVVALLILALWLLLWSLVSRLRKVQVPEDDEDGVIVEEKVVKRRKAE